MGEIVIVMCTARKLQLQSLIVLLLAQNNDYFHSSLSIIFNDLFKGLRCTL